MKPYPRPQLLFRCAKSNKPSFDSKLGLTSRRGRPFYFSIR
jgi:hypothetical protein